MQVKDQTVIGRNKYAFLAKGLKVTITLACLYFMWVQFQKEEIDFGATSWPPNAVLVITEVLLLMILNWYLEALRWKMSLASIEKISIREAWKSVLGGLALNWVFPFTSGDFVARIRARKDKYQTASALILNRGIMLFITSCFGVFSLLFYEQSFLSFNKLTVLLFAVLLILLFFFRKNSHRFIRYFKEIPRRVLVQISALSIFRYFIFTFQFYWLLAVFNPELLPITIIAGIGWVFLARSMIPHLLGGIGLREAASVIFFTPFVSDITMILIPVFLIWVLNTVLPSVCGLLFIWKMRSVNFR